MKVARALEPIAFSPVPLYTQVREALRERILDGTYPPHAQLPSESEMVALFKVRRITVSINGLAVLVEQALGLDPFASCAYVFSNRRRDRVKILG
ncbi:hypothetical protein GmRootV59_52510 (plasmid) [Variovorax sp. V59]